MGLKQKFRNWLMRDDNMKVRAYECEPCRVEESHEMRSPASLNFKVYKAVGSHIVEFYRYDRQTDRSHTTLYTIDEQSNFGEELAKITTLELFK